MKKVLVIGDIHGRFDWNVIANETAKSFVSKIIFLGDYVDAYDKKKYPGFKQLENLKSIITFAKKMNESKLKPEVHLLLGNHDYAYIHGDYAVSGHQKEMSLLFKEVFDKNKDIFKIAYGIKENNGKYTLFSHAGLTNGFYRNYVLSKFQEGKFLNRFFNKDYYDGEDIADLLNLLINDPDIGNIGPMRSGGYSMRNPGPLWADIKELNLDPYKGINQVVGHTAFYTIELFKINNDKNQIIKVDNIGDNTASILLSFDI